MGNIGCERKAKPSKANPQTGNPFVNSNYEEFKKYFILDQEYGVSYQTDLITLSSPVHLELEAFCINLPTYVKDGNVIDKPTNDRQLDRKIYGFLIYLLNAFLFTQLPNPPQILIKEIAVPLYKFSRVLDVKPSMGWLQHMGNWKLNGDDKFDIRNLSCRYTFTGRRDEEVFFLMSSIADFRFAIVIQEIFNVNKILGQVFNQLDGFSQLQNQYQLLSVNFSNLESEKIRFRRELENYTDSSTEKLVINCLQVMKEQINEITSSLKLMFEFNDPKFFYCVLRNFLKGYSEHTIFPQGLKFEEVDQIFFSEGGSGGNSPSFQIFERSLGIKFEGGFEMIQQSMRAGMMKEHKELIEITQKYSYIRAYCDLSENQELKKQFNETIQGYINFNERHLYYISYYIEQQILALGGDPTKAIGTGSVPVTLIKDKYKMFKKFFIESYQSGHYFEVFDSKEAGSTNKEKIALYGKLFRTTIPSKTKRIFDKKCGFYIDLEGYANKLILPNKGELCLIQQFLVFQVFVHAFHHWTLEILVTDIGKTKRRIVLTSSVKEIEFHHFHVKSPIDLIRREKWLNLCIDVWSFMEAFPNCTFRSIDGIIIGAPCKLRKIFLMRNPLEDSEMDLTFPQGFMPVPKQVNFPEGFEHSNQIVTYRLLNFQEFQLSQQTQHIPEDPNEVYQYQQSQKSQFQKYEEQNTQQKLMDPDSGDEEQPSSYFQDVENNEDEYLDVVYDPDLKCYFDPKTNEYYQLA